MVLISVFQANYYTLCQYYVLHTLFYNCLSRMLFLAQCPQPVCYLSQPLKQLRPYYSILCRCQLLNRANRKYRLAAPYLQRLKVTIFSGSGIAQIRSYTVRFRCIMQWGLHVQARRCLFPATSLDLFKASNCSVPYCLTGFIHLLMKWFCSTTLYYKNH